MHLLLMLLFLPSQALRVINQNLDLRVAQAVKGRALDLETALDPVREGNFQVAARVAECPAMLQVVGRPWARQVDQRGFLIRLKDARE